MGEYLTDKEIKNKFSEPKQLKVLMAIWDTYPELFYGGNLDVLFGTVT